MTTKKDDSKEPAPHKETKAEHEQAHADALATSADETATATAKANTAALSLADYKASVKAALAPLAAKIANNPTTAVDFHAEVTALTHAINETVDPVHEIHAARLAGTLAPKDMVAPKTLR